MAWWHRVGGAIFLFAFAILAMFASSALAGRVIDLRGQVNLRIIGRKSLDHLGRSIAAGDFNNDGWDDLAIGADDSDPTGNISGQVYILFGGPTISGNIDMATRIPDVDIWGGADEGRLGHNMTVADLNGDGIDDLIVLDHNAGPEERHTAGTTHVFFGGTRTWDQPVIDMTTTSADVTIWSAVDGEHAGSVYAVADLNHDDIDDLVLGAPASNRIAERVVNSGAVYVVHGRHDLAGPVDLLTDADLRIRGVEPASFFGSSLAVADLNSDGAADLAVGLKGLDRSDTIDTGAVYIFFSVDEMTGTVELSERKPDTVLWGAAGQRVGAALAAGDVNGDGQPDLLIGAPSASPDERYHAGAAYVVLGPLGEGEANLPTVAAVAVWGPAANARAGEAVALWDLGGDGLAEVLVNVPEADVEGRVRAGLLAILNGQTSFESPVVDLAANEPDVAVWGGDPYTTGTWYLLTTGDLDNNGHADLLVGIVDTRPVERNGAGTVYGLFNIIPSQPTATPSPTPTWTIIPTPSTTLTTTSTATLTQMSPPTSTATPIPTATATVTATATSPPTPGLYLPLIVRR